MSEFFPKAHSSARRTVRRREAAAIDTLLRIFCYLVENTHGDARFLLFPFSHAPSSGRQSQITLSCIKGPHRSAKVEHSFFLINHSGEVFQSSPTAINQKEPRPLRRCEQKKGLYSPELGWPLELGRAEGAPSRASTSRA